MEAITASILGLLGKTIGGKILGKPTEEILSSLEVKRAFNKALSAAILRYARQRYSALTAPLTGRKSPLKNTDVATEISYLLRFERDPDYQIIGKAWQASFDVPPPGHNYTEEARILLGFIKDELQNTNTFRPVFESHNLNDIAENAQESADVLANIQLDLEELITLLESHLGKLLQKFTGSTSGIRDKIHNYSRYIAEKTRGFVGRQWVFERVKSFIKENPHGYFFIIGDPGIGKSALTAQLIKENGYIHHFNIRAEGINKAANFLRNVCSQLIAAYNLEYDDLPPEALEDSGFLNKLLEQVSQKLEPNESCVIVVDALDEVAISEDSKGTNLLYLPTFPPEGVYFVATTRDVPERMPRIECKQSELRIEADSSSNEEDVKDFLRSVTKRPEIHEFIIQRRINEEEFTNFMLLKSEGNFIYLHYVLPKIANGAYNNLELDKIPAGLKNYYEDHWKRIRSQEGSDWFDYGLPVIIALAVAYEPISIEIIAYFTKIKKMSRIRGTLSEWNQFLYKEEVEVDSTLATCYRLYHQSFFDFIAAKEEIIDERVDLKAMHDQVAGSLSDELLDDE